MRFKLVVNKNLKIFCELLIAPMFLYRDLFPTEHRTCGSFDFFLCGNGICTKFCQMWQIEMLLFLFFWLAIFLKCSYLSTALVWFFLKWICFLTRTTITEYSHFNLPEFSYLDNKPDYYFYTEIAGIGHTRVNLSFLVGNLLLVRQVCTISLYEIPKFFLIFYHHSALVIYWMWSENGCGLGSKCKFVIGKMATLLSVRGFDFMDGLKGIWKQCSDNVELRNV